MWYVPICYVKDKISFTVVQGSFCSVEDSTCANADCDKNVNEWFGLMKVKSDHVVSHLVSLTTISRLPFHWRTTGLFLKRFQHGLLCGELNVLRFSTHRLLVLSMYVTLYNLRGG